jgi:hypothetical protein
MFDDSTILAAIIGAVATISAAVISVVVTLRVSRRKRLKKQPVANFLHAQRDYTRTQRRLERMMTGFLNTDQKPDLYLTNFGTPLRILKRCKGYSDYHTYLAELTRTNRCVLHMYCAITNEPGFRTQLDNMILNHTGHTDANFFCYQGSPFGYVGGTIVNFLALTETFAAVTFETSSKVIISLHTTNPREVSAVIEVIRSIEPQCKRILVNGEKLEGID